MANIPERWFQKDQWYFVTINTQYRQKIFSDDSNCSLLLDSLDETRKHRPFRTAGYAILPDHIHLLIQPDNGFNISDIIDSAKRNFLKRKNEDKKSRSICQHRLGLCGLIFSTLLGRLGRRHTFGCVNPCSRIILSTVLRLI